eukprot:7172215-Pyramimonas_sp.AAC.1
MLASLVQLGVDGLIGHAYSQRDKNLQRFANETQPNLFQHRWKLVSRGFMRPCVPRTFHSLARIVCHNEKCKGPHAKDKHPYSHVPERTPD